MRYVSINDVTPGMVLARDLVDGYSRLLARAGKPVTSNMIYKLRDMGIPGFYIQDRLSKDVNIEPLISEETRQAAINDLRTLNIDNAMDTARKMVKELLSVEKLSLELITLKSYHDYTYQHSVNVATIAAMIGIGLQLSEEELVNLASVGLLHDIGKIWISNDILNKPGALTQEEFEEIKKHPEYGYQMLKKNFNVSATIKTGVFEHHENEDGSGYPRQLIGDKIHRYAKIIHIADVYDALTSKRPYRDPSCPSDAIEFLLANCSSMFDEKYVRIFTKYVPAYPKGVTVELSNGEKGIVIENYADFVLRPKIIFFNGKEVSLKDDMSYMSVVINRAIVW